MDQHAAHQWCRSGGGVLLSYPEIEGMRGCKVADFYGRKPLHRRSGSQAKCRLRGSRNQEPWLHGTSLPCYGC